MTYFDSDFELPKEYTSLTYLRTKLGDVGTVESMCYIWNNINGWQTNYLRIKEIDERLGQITLTGRCTDEKKAVMICSWLVSNCVSVRYEKTITTINIEV